MTHHDLHRAVARVTGETVREIGRRGFDLLDPPVVDDEETARCLDWDAVDRRRNVALVEQPAADAVVF